MVIGHLNANVTNAQRILRQIAQKIPSTRTDQPCSCAQALATSIVTDPKLIPAEVKEKYQLLIEKYIS